MEALRNLTDSDLCGIIHAEKIGKLNYNQSLIINEIIKRWEADKIQLENILGPH